MLKIVILVSLSAVLVFGGTISGELIYSGGGIGAYGVIVLGPSELVSLASGDSIDYSSLPIDIMISPGDYSIEGEFADTLPYNAFGVKLEDISVIRPLSGDPMGIYPERFFTSSGDASGIDVELATEGAIGGHITYSGDIEDVKINVYDIMTGTAILEDVYPVGTSADYSITVPSGFKFLDFFVDLNDNDVWDIGASEPGIRYMGIDTATWGPVVFAGGGDRFATGVDPIIPAVSVDEKSSDMPKSTILCTPNPFNSEAILKYTASNNAMITIADISGKIIEQTIVNASGEIKIGKNLESGIYIVSIKDGKNVMQEKIIIMR